MKDYKILISNIIINYFLSIFPWRLHCIESVEIIIISYPNNDHYIHYISCRNNTTLTVLPGEWIQHVLEQASAMNYNEQQLYGEVQSFGVEQMRARALLRAYQVHRQRVKELDERPPVVSRHLTNTDWSVALELAGPHNSAVHRTRGVLQLHLAGPAGQSRTAQSTSEPLVLDLTHDELFALFSNLEDIQEQLDSLGA